MADFIYTVDEIGDDALTDSIIEQSITNFVDDKITTLGYKALAGCSQLESVDFYSLKSMAQYAMSGRFNNLKALILRSSTQVSAPNNALPASLPSEGYIYVPSALIANYTRYDPWKSFTSKFRALEDYTVDGTITGALDPSKI